MIKQHLNALAHKKKKTQETEWNKRQKEDSNASVMSK